MSSSEPATAPEPSMTPDQLREQIEQTRADLADTVDALAAKADIKGQAKEKAHELTDSVKDKAAAVKDKAADLAGSVKDKAGELKDRASDKAGAASEKAGHLKEKAISSDGGTASRHRAPVDEATGVATYPAGDPFVTGASTVESSGPGVAAQAKDKVAGAASSVASAASGAASSVRAKVSGTGGDEGDLGSNVVAPRPRSTAVTAGIVASVLAAVAVLVIVRQRRADR